MKRPLSNQETRWMVRHMPDSLGACGCLASLAMRRLVRDFLGIYIAPVVKWAGLEVKQPYRKYLKDAPHNRP